MNKKEALEILAQYQLWRTDDEYTEMLSATKVTRALNFAWTLI